MRTNILGHTTLPIAWTAFLRTRSDRRLLVAGLAATCAVLVTLSGTGVHTPLAFVLLGLIVVQDLALLGVTHRVAELAEHAVDERQEAVRNHAYRLAYRIVMHALIWPIGLVSSSWAECNLQPQANSLSVWIVERAAWAGSFPKPHRFSAAEASWASGPRAPVHRCRETFIFWRAQPTTVAASPNAPRRYCSCRLSRWSWPNSFSQLTASQPAQPSGQIQPGAGALFPAW